VTARILLVGLIAGVLLALASGGTSLSGWRLALLPVALAAVVAGLLGTVRLGRAEWRRSRPPRGDYARIVGLFAGAFLLTVLALR